MILVAGEILVDCFEGEGKKERHLGGAPLNVACDLKKLGSDVSFLGAVGKDEEGQFLLDELKRNGLAWPVHVLPERKTTEAIVSLQNGERSFRFERENGADYSLDPSWWDELPLEEAKIIHLGSLCLSEEEGRRFFFESVPWLRKKTHALLSFDVNYREDLYPDPNFAKEISLRAVSDADIVKFSEEEAILLSGKKDPVEGVSSLLKEDQLGALTLGEKGSYLFYQGKKIHAPTFPMTPIDTTGAGDAFYAYLLSRLEDWDGGFEEEAMREILYRANLAGGFATQKKGAVEGMPSWEEVEAFASLHSLASL